MVDVQEADPVVLPVGRPKRVSAEQVRRQAVVDLAEIEELDLPSVLADGVVDQLDHLVVADPAAGMVHQGENPPLDHGGVDGRFHVGHGVRVVGALQVVPLPVVRHRAGDLPAEPGDDVGVRVVFHVIEEIAVARNVLIEPLPPRRVHHDFSRQGGVVGCEEHEHRRIDRQEIALRRGPVEISVKNRGLTEFIESQQGMR